MYKTITTEVDVDVDLSYFGTNDLLDELESRGDLPVDSETDAKELLESIWLKRRQGRTDYQKELDDLIYACLGKVI